MRWIKAKLSDLYDKIVKEQKPAGFIARGWALGVFVGSVIPFGFQIYIALPLSFILRCSKVGGFLLAAIATPIAYFAVLSMVRAYRRRKDDQN
jgi:uncharacterized protein (DUF2062 family)